MQISHHRFGKGRFVSTVAEGHEGDPIEESLIFEDSKGRTVKIAVVSPGEWNLGTAKGTESLQITSGEAFWDGTGFPLRTLMFPGAGTLSFREGQRVAFRCEVPTSYVSWGFDH